jgi:hypothetical protein
MTSFDPATYGVRETNPIRDYSGSTPGLGAPLVDLEDPILHRITRLRMVTDAGFPWWDVSYCYGELQDGTPVRVLLPFGQIRRGPGFTRRLVDEFARVGRNAKQMGALDNLSLLS